MWILLEDLQMNLHMLSTIEFLLVVYYLTLVDTCVALFKN